ncbi:MAG TPA: hypothetical protein VFJ65_05760, partial [Solirubrobacterales bacterium]|nr:hypothetical protein [Solirubrobacterales bacterium]
LRFGAGGKASRQRPSVSDGHPHPGHTGSFARLITALKLWLLSTLPVVQIASRSAPDPKAPEAHSEEYEQELLKNLEADTRLKKLQAQGLEDEHELRQLKKREHRINIENGEIRRDLTLAGVVVIGAMLVAGFALEIVAPGLKPPGPDLFEFFKLLLS